MDRRGFLKGLSGAGALALGAVGIRARSARADLPDPDVDVISGHLALPTLTVLPGRTLRFDPDADVTLELAGNLLVYGTLEMRPSPQHVHRIRFVGAQESLYQGGGMDPLPTDVGLWVLENGRLQIEGTPCEAWNRSGDSPTWVEGDELWITPTARGDFEPRMFTRGDPVPDGAGTKAEVVNLTRNVVIEGTPMGRAHVWIHSTWPQTIRYVVLQNLGPRRAEGAFTAGVPGRYPLHFHMMGDASRGSIVEGVVVRRSGFHAFVSHGSHGITFRDCVAFDVMDDAYTGDTDDDYSNVTYDRCVACWVRCDPPFRGFRLSAFSLGNGTGQVARNCVATAVQGTTDANGFSWGNTGLWTFEDNLAHNNRINGIFVWDNEDGLHAITRFTAYRCGEAGIEHGAYSNRYRYADVTLAGNGASVHLRAASKPLLAPDGPQTWDRVIADTPMEIVRHHVPAGAPAIFTECRFPKVTIDHGDSTNRGLYDFVRCGLAPADFAVTRMAPGSVVRALRDDGTAFMIDASGAVSDIPPFTPGVIEGAVVPPRRRFQPGVPVGAAGVEPATSAL